MEFIEIKRVAVHDIGRLQKIGRQTFYETFVAGNTEENMIRYLDEKFSAGHLMAELNDKNTEFYFATYGKDVIGYLKLNSGQSQTELQDDTALEIERIYVLKEFHGKKAGQVLYEKAMQIAEQKDACYIWLGVWENNPRAIRFYKKNGFVEFGRHIFKLGNDEQTDIMMKLELNDSTMNGKQIKAYGTEAAGAPLKDLNIQRRSVTPHDVQIEILYCGICHSDLHAAKNEWGKTTYPIVPGHEIIGKVTRVGDSVTKFKAGDLAGVGCIVDSCRECDYCKAGEEQFCERGNTIVFNAADKCFGGITYGGFSESIVVDENYVVHIPGTLDLPGAAPILCAGITVYSPFKHWNVGPGKKVGIIGVGGLGHMAIKIAKAMGASVTVFTTSGSKTDDAKRLGADEVVLSTDNEQMKAQSKFDMILDTVSAKHDVNAFLNILKVDGALVLVGLPVGQLPVGAFNLVHGRKSFAGSNIGGISETQEVLNFCAEHNITADIELINVAQINEAFERLEKGHVKYRFVIDMASLRN